MKGLIFFSEFVSLKIYHFWYYSWLCPNLPWKAYYFFWYFLFLQLTLLI